MYCSNLMALLFLLLLLLASASFISVTSMANDAAEPSLTTITASTPATSTTSMASTVTVTKTSTVSGSAQDAASTSTATVTPATTVTPTGTTSSSSTTPQDDATTSATTVPTITATWTTSSSSTTGQNGASTATVTSSPTTMADVTSSISTTVTPSSSSITGLAEGTVSSTAATTTSSDAAVTSTHAATATSSQQRRYAEATPENGTTTSVWNHPSTLTSDFGRKFLGLPPLRIAQHSPLEVVAKNHTMSNKHPTVVSTEEDDESDEDEDTVTSGSNGTVASGKTSFRKPAEETNGTETVPRHDQGELPLPSTEEENSAENSAENPVVTHGKNATNSSENDSTMRDEKASEILKPLKSQNRTKRGDIASQAQEALNNAQKVLTAQMASANAAFQQSQPQVYKLPAADPNGGGRPQSYLFTNDRTNISMLTGDNFLSVMTNMKSG